MRAASIRVLALAIAGAFACAIPAQAQLTYLGSFGGPGNGSGQFAGGGGGAGPSGIAVNRSSGNPASGHIYVTDRSNHRIEEFDSAGVFVRMWGRGVNQTSGGDLCPRPGNPADVCGAGSSGAAAGWFSSPQGVGVDSPTGAVYVQDAGNRRIQKFSADGTLLFTWGKAVNQTSGGDLCPRPGNPADVCQAGTTSDLPGGFSGWDGSQGGNTTPNLAVDDAGYVYVGEPNTLPYARVQKFDSSGGFVGQIAAPASKANERGVLRTASLAVASTGDVYVEDARPAGFRIGAFDATDFSAAGTDASYEFLIAEGLSRSRPAIDPHNQYVFAAGSAVFCGTAGTAIYEYHPASGQQVDCTPLGAPAVTTVSATATASTAAHRLYVADGPAAQVRVYETPVESPPAVGDQTAGEITSTKAVVRTEIAANLAETTYRVEYGTSPCSEIPNPCTSTAESDGVGAAFAPRPVSVQIPGLAPATTYHYRFVATNEAGTDAGPDRSFTTFSSPTFDPSCPNNLARQQTGAAFLLDCRAYELVSAADTGGYNVESDLVPGQSPYPGFPGAGDRALYAVHDGVVPGSGKPTNRGPDPYLSTRDAEQRRWVTRYVGVPADAPSLEPFSSTLAGADAGLDSFVFGGPEICAPCFDDGSAGMPLRISGGDLVQGMVGSEPVAEPAPAGAIRKHFSADGAHLIFGSKQKLEPEANSSGTDVTIYDRDLTAGTTQVVSTDEAGDAIANGDGVAALDVSANGSRILIGRWVSTDAAGNPYYDLYMHVGTSPSSFKVVDTPSGVLFAGMTADGSRVFFTTRDQLGSDVDASADLFRATVGGTVIVNLLSRGEPGTGDSDACDPVGNSANPRWNVVAAGPADCSVVPIGGGGGVATESGAAYFLSPERLDTSGPTDPVLNAPNLYLSQPGAPLQFVATLESELTGPQPPIRFYGFGQGFGSFSRTGGIAVDPAGGSVYVFDVGASAKEVRKFDLAGNPVNFTAGSGAGTNRLIGSDAPTGVFAPNSVQRFPAQLAVDPSSGRLYVPDFGKNVVDVFSSTGQYLSQLAVTAPSGVAIHPISHDVYVTSRSTAKVVVFPAGGGPSANFSVITNPSGVAVDSTGVVYVVNNNQTAEYSPAGAFVKVLEPGASFAVAVDPSNDDVFINRGRAEIVQLDASGTPTEGFDGLGGPIGVGDLSSTAGIAVDGSGHLLAANLEGAVRFDRALKPNVRIDSPLVINSVGEADERHTADFQTTPSGELATFSSLLPLTGFDSAGHAEVFRYDAVGDQLVCVSCNPTGQPPAGGAALASQGLSLTDDGRVFFTTGDSLVLRDTNGRKDAYEWSDGVTELISSGQNSFDSGLHSVSADGTDVFFFTRERLVSDDLNGSLTKLYDAREGGGLFEIPPPPPCAASDECHGPGSPQPPPPAINTVAASGGNQPATRPKCRRGTVRKKGRCVPRKPRGKHRSRRANR